MPRIALAQITSTADVAANAARCVALVARAARERAEAVFFPEASDYIAEGKEQSMALAEPLQGGAFAEAMSATARAHGVWVSVGVHERGPPPQGRFFNTHLLFDAAGAVAAAYRKVHLFDVAIEGGPQLRESDAVIAGDTLGAPVDTPIGRVALQTCYDMRFPEHSRHLRDHGADILTFPSAFTVPTGRAHWEVLLRARAIENQAFVIAAAQVGRHNAQRESYGHGMVVDPWGTVVARFTDDTEGIVYADLDFGVLERTRREMPVFAHRRLDLY